MKKDSGSAVPAAMMLLLGIGAMVLRNMLYAVAVDVKGLLLRNHPLEIAVALLTAAVLVMLVLFVRRLENTGDYGDFHWVRLLGALGNAAAAAGILATVMTAAPEMEHYLENIWRILGLGASVCLGLAGIARGLGRRPFFLLHVVACVFLMLHIVTRYQLWSSQPQMQDYVFALLGAMALMFFGFYTAAMEAGCGNRRMTTGMGLAAIYLCTAELARSSCPELYLGGLVWVLMDLCSIGKTTAQDRQ